MTVLILSLVTEPLMDSALQPQGVFFLFAGFSFIAVFYVYFYMAESKGLPEKQKKSLYIPGAKFGRKLKPGEEAPEVSITPTLPSRGTDGRPAGIGDSEITRKTFESQNQYIDKHR